MREGFEIVDCHHHVGHVWHVQSAQVGHSEDLELATRLATMDENGVDRSVVIPAHGYLRPDGIADTRAVNDAIAGYRDQRPDRFLAAVGIVEPLYGPVGSVEVERIAVELGLRGVSFHPRFQGAAINSALVKDLIQRMGEFNLVPYLHAVAEVTDSNIPRLLDLARSFPDMTMIVVDPFSSSEQGSQTLMIAELAPNLVFDTSLSYRARDIVELISRCGAHRVVFGTDLYSAPSGYQRSTVLQHLLEIELPREDLQAMFARNIEAIIAKPIGSS